MGVNNKQRRAAKQRRRSRDRTRPPGGPGTSPGAEHPFWDFGQRGPGAWRDLADLEVESTVQLMTGRKPLSDAGARREAQWLLGRVQPVPPAAVGQAMTSLLRRLWAEVVRGGWCAADLGELARRRVGEDHLFAVEVAAGAEPDAMSTPDGLASGLRLAALLSVVPLAPPNASGAAGNQSGARPALSVENAKKLATVRGLLAKAERTSFDEEAEALSAKAQELISRYALERLLQEDAAGSTESRALTTRRIWLDAPYLMAKASLVDAVAGANRCRCVVSESLGVCSVVGDPLDLDAVELLSTSLLVQANRSMLRHGRHVDLRGVSRTRSFRQSFLVSFGTRIGQRLLHETERAIGEIQPGTQLLPVLRDQETRVDEAFEAMFPHVVQTETAVTNGLGWAAGHAAADLALLDVHTQITGAARP
ncbi:MAG: DUF2786 domain-containing protein [Marmoricola sp.]